MGVYCGIYETATSKMSEKFNILSSIFFLDVGKLLHFSAYKH